jgi:magnesium transporter
MENIQRQKSKFTVGLPPGSVIYTGEPTTGKARITRFVYDRDHYLEETVEEPSTIRRPGRHEGVTWINIDGVADTGLLAAIGEEFSIHPLVMEDIANVDQRPKVESYDGYLFITLKMLTAADSESLDIRSEQMSIVLGPDFVLSFQERIGDTFDAVRNRIRTGGGRVRSSGADYLAYALVDSIVDYYFVLLEAVGDTLESLEEMIYDESDQKTVREVHRLKREIIDLRRAVWPMREVVNLLERDESGRISKSTRPFLRDLYDHVIQVVDTVESFRDAATGLVDLHMSASSNRMNEVMKVLTIISTIFIPLTFIVGIYGMNFDPAAGPFSMPELSSPFGYAAVLGVMIIVAIGMIIFFRRKKWL